MKYLGSKSRLAKDLLKIMLLGRSKGQYWVEPFAGGMNLLSKVTGPRIGNDSNYYLIEMWKFLIEGWIPPTISKGEYARIKQDIVGVPPHLVGWVGFNCSYSGKWFGGFAGKTMTKGGGVRDYQAEALRNVLRQVKQLKGVVLTNQDYQKLVFPLGSIVYCDPPYLGTTGYHSTFDSTLFWGWVRRISVMGNRVFVSEYTAPDDFVRVYQKKVVSSLSANGVCGGSKPSVESLFVFKGTLESTYLKKAKSRKSE